MADVFDTPPTPEELNQVAPPPSEPEVADKGPAEARGARHLPVSAKVFEPADGIPVTNSRGPDAPIQAGESSPGVWDTPPTDQELSAAQPAASGPNPEALKFVAQHGDLPNEGRAAEIIRYSAASKLPADLVAADLENIKKRVDAQGVDWKKLAERQPALAQYMAENPHAIPLVQGDTHNLGVLEWAFGGHPFEAFMDAVHQQGTVGLQFLRAEGVPGGDTVIQHRLDEERASAQRFGPDYGAHNLVMKGLVGTAKMLPYMALDKVSRVAGALLGGIGGASAGAETGPGAVVTGTGGAALGQFAASGVFNYAEALGPLSWELDHFRDANGQRIDPAVANIAAQTASVVSGTLMSGTMGLYTGKAAPAIQGWVQKALPSVAKATTGLAENAVVKWLADGAVRGTIAKFLGRWGLHAAIGAGMMVANSAVTTAATIDAKLASGIQVKPGDLWDSVASSGAQAFQDLWLLSAIPAVRQHMEDRGLARKSAEDAARFEKAVEAAKNSSVLAKSPEAFEQFMDLTAPDAKVYVPAEQWMSYFQAKKLDGAEVAQRAGVTPEALSNAVTNGGNLEFKASKFMTELVPDGHAEGLSMDMKSRPELLTAREFKAKQDSEAKRLVEDAKSRAAELDAGKKAIEDFFLSQAKASKLKSEEFKGVRSGVKLLSEAAAAQALKLNVSLQESASILNYGELSLTGKEGLTPAHEEAARAFREWLAPDASQQLKARLASLSPENRARELYLDANTGLPNATHFEDLNAHEEATAFPSDDRQYAHVSVAGTKFINDSTDHGQGDLLYRAAGKALHDAAPDLDVSKPGGDFEFRVRDQAHLDEVLKKANENLPPELKPFVLTGAVGATREAAEKAHVELKKAAEAAGTRALRADASGKAVAPLGFAGDVKALKLPTEKVAREPHPELAKQVSAMSDEDYFKKAYVEPKTGLLTNLGWQKLNHDSSYHYAALDLRGLKDANARWGKEGGDTLIRVFGKMLSHFGGSSFDAAHLHGDEYAMRHRDPYKLSQMVERLRENLKTALEWTSPDGEKVDVGIDFWHGISRGSYEAADRVLSERKAGVKAATPHVAPRAPAGGEDHGGEGGRAGSLAGRGEALGRGAQPQGYPGADRTRSFNQEAVTVPQPILDARAFIGRMRDPERIAQANAFLAYATGETDKRPEISPKLEQELADKFGIVDPQGYAFDEQGRALDRSTPGRKSFGEEPEELKKYRLSRTMSAEEYMALPEKHFKQEPIAHIEGRPVTLEQGGSHDAGGDLGRGSGAGEQGPDVLRSEGTGGGDEPRGEIRLDVTGSGRPRAFDIRILNGDKSTFVHEAAHFLSWSLHDLATSDLATDSIRKDYDTLLKFAGYESADARLAALKEGGGRKEEERISHGFEQYLAEGKAPSRSLARVFSRFKGWLLSIYQGAQGVQQQYQDRYGEQIALSDDVRQVFDRLLAQDTALKDASKAVGGTGPMKEALAGMTPEDAAKYLKTLADAKADAEQETARGEDERQKQMDAQREAFRQQTADELDAKPVYRAWRYLQHGDLPDALDPEHFKQFFLDEDGKPFKINRADLEKEYGPDVVKRMPPNSVKNRSGIPVDILAPLLGFNSGDDLVNALAGATPRDEAIAQGTQDRMDAAHGPELERATEAALSGVHSGKALEAAVMELRAVAKQISPELARRAHAVDVEAIRRNIERMTGEKQVGELNPSNYARTERKLAIEAAELRGRGEREAAYDKLEQRLVNKLLFMSERDARKELKSARDRLTNPSESIRADLGKADPAYRDVHDAILSAVGLAPARAGEGRGLDEMLATAERDGHETGPWVDSVRRLLGQPTPWKELSVDQARDVRDAITNVRHIADESLNITILGEKRSLDGVRLAIASRTATVQPAIPRPKYGGQESSLREKAASKHRAASAALQEIETVAEMMDGGTQGPAHDLLVYSRLEARDREVELIKQVLAPIKEAFEQVPKDIRRLRDQSVDVAHLLPTPMGQEAGYTRSFLWSLFLNMGNEGNLQRLRDGNKWTDTNMRAAVSLLTEPELDFLQKVRDTANSLHPELAKAYEKRTGLVLPKVEATPIAINGKEYAGGYWPIRYDKTAEGNQGNRQEINDIKDLFPTNTSPVVSNSSTKARQNIVLAPLDLTWGTVPSHFATVIHDIAYGDWVRQVAKVLIKPRVPNPEVPSFDKTATDYLGPERAKEFLPWLRDVAAARADSTAGHVTDLVKDTGFLRSRLASAVIMLNIPSSVRHTIDPLTTMADSEAVLPHYIADAYRKVMNPLSWGNHPEFALSKELEYRRATHDDNLRTELQRMGKVTGALQKATEVGFAVHKWVDAFTTRVAFKAAYDQAIANGATQEQAVQRGDDVVRRSFPSGDIAEKPPILRTRQGWAAAITFYGYASKMNNLRSRAFDRFHRAWAADGATGTDTSAPGREGVGGAAVTVAAKMITLGLVSAIGGYVAGRGPSSKEDDEKGFAASRAEWLATEVMLSPMDDVPPIVGPAVKATLLGHKTNIASVPELSLLDHQLSRVGSFLHGKKQEDDESKVWSAAAVLVGLLGPVGQAQRTIPYLGNVVSGRERPRGPFDFGAGVMYGTHKDQGANPLTDLQNVISGRR